MKFLSRECDQHGSVFSGGCPSGGTDLNDDGDADDLVIRLFDLATGTTQTIGTVTRRQSARRRRSRRRRAARSTSRPAPAARSAARARTSADCGAGSFCESGTCTRDQGVCATNADCPPGIDVRSRWHRPREPRHRRRRRPRPPRQLHLHPERRPDRHRRRRRRRRLRRSRPAATACSRAARSATGPSAACAPARVSPTARVPARPPSPTRRPKVDVKTKGESGQLSAKMVIPLGAVQRRARERPARRRRLAADRPAHPRARSPPSGGSGNQWQFKSKPDGLTAGAAEEPGPEAARDVPAHGAIRSAGSRPPRRTTPPPIRASR